MMYPLVLTALWLICVNASLILSKKETHPILVSTLEGKPVTTLGELSFTNEHWQLERKERAIDDLDLDVKYCIGVGTLEQGRCLNYKYLTPNDDLVIYVDENQEIADLLLILSLRKTGLKLKVKQITKGAVPKLKPKIIEKALDGTTKVKEEEKPEEKSFIQKYWMYIVSALLVILVLGDSGAK